jgi:peptide/nickel transport system permease protein
VYAYLVRRVLWMVPTFLGILVITFGVLRWQEPSLAENLGAGAGSEAGDRRADSKALGNQVDAYLRSMRRTGMDLPAVVNLRGFIGKDGALAWLRQAERGPGRADAAAFRAETRLWAAGPLLVEPLAAILADPALDRYHAPALTALTYCAQTLILNEEAERRGEAWTATVRDRNAAFAACRASYRNDPRDGFASSDADLAGKIARVQALLAADPAAHDRSIRRWTAVLGETGFTDLMVKMATGSLYSERLKQPAFALIADRWGVTAALNILSILIAWGIAVPLGIRSARRLGTFEDQATTQSLFLLWSLPSFFVGSLLLYYLCTDHSDGWKATFPNRGIQSDGAELLSTLAWLGDAAWHLALPLLTLSYASFVGLSRYLRGSILDNLESDYARTARAKGVAEDDVVYRHVVPNSLITMITLGAGLLSSLFGGALIVEYIFVIPGLGTLLLDAAKAQDAPIVMASTVISVGLLLIGILIADILYAVADPRVRARYG